MSIQLVEHYHAAEIRIRGKFLGALDGDAFNQILSQIKEKNISGVVINLSETEMVDSTAIGLFIKALTSMRREDGDVRLAGMQNRIKNVFLMTRLLGSVFKNFDSVEEAVESFASTAEA